MQEQKFIETDKFKISYFEKNPNASHTVFFIHGNSGSAATWKYQWESPYFNNFRLIAIELPGHGFSSESDNPLTDYSPIGTGKILSKVITSLIDNTPYSFVGFSYGTNLIAEFLIYGICPVKIILISPTVPGTGAKLDTILLNPEASIYLKDGLDAVAVKTFMGDQIISDDPEVYGLYLSDYLKTVRGFRSALIQSAAEGIYSDEILALQNLDIPLLIVFGEKDKQVNIHYMDELALNLWKNKLYVYPDASHYIQIEMPGTLNALMLEYLTET